MIEQTVFVKFAFIKSCPIRLSFCISKQFSKIRISSKFEPISSKIDRFAKIYGVYEVSLAKIPRIARARAKFHKILKFWISLSSSESESKSYQLFPILPKFNQINPNLKLFDYFWSNKLFEIDFSGKSLLLLRNRERGLIKLIKQSSYFI